MYFREKIYGTVPNASIREQALQATGTMSLDFAEYIPNKTVRSLVIFCHGYGSDKKDLIELAPHMGHAMPETVFVSPNGVEPCERGFGRQWFSLLSMSKEDIYTGLEAAHPHFDAFISEQKTRFSLTEDRIALVGFSQGTMLCLHTALRRRQKLAGVVGFSGLLAGSDVLKQQIKSTPPILLVHGDDDTIISPEFMRLASEALIKHGCLVDTLLCSNLAHGIDNQGLLTATKFIQKCFCFDTQ